MSTTDAKIVVRVPLPIDPEIPEEYGDKIVLERVLEENDYRIWIEQPVDIRYAGDSRVDVTVGETDLAVCELHEGEGGEKRARCFIPAVAEIRDRALHVTSAADNLGDELHDFIYHGPGDYWLDLFDLEDREHLPRIKAKYLQISDEKHTYKVIQSNQFYDLVARYLTYVRNNSLLGRKLSSNQYVDYITELLSKRVPNEADEHIGPAQLAVDLAIKILNTPDETDKFLPKVGFSMNTCLLIFDLSACSSTLISKIQELYEKDASARRYLIRKDPFVTEPLCVKGPCNSYYVAKIEDGICRLFMSELNNYAELACFLKSLPQQKNTAQL